MHTSTKILLFATLFVAAGKPVVATAQTPMDATVNSATAVLDEIMALPAKAIPVALLSNAHGVAIFPNVIKGGFVVGVRHGNGVVLVRDEAGAWQPPMFATLTGGSVGWQAGIQATDVILVFKSQRSLDGLMTGKLTIGADAAAAAGPVGRQAAAATDARLGAEILSYSRSRGLFAGVSIDGSALQLDQAAGAAYYSAPVAGPSGEIYAPGDALPASAVRLMNHLAQYTGAPQIAVADPAAEGIPGAGGPALSGPAMVPPASQLPAPTTAVPPVEAARQRLIGAWQKLSAQLDEQWNKYLAPPAEVLTGQPVERKVLETKLKQYDLVASNAQYAALAKNDEFATTYQLLKEYAALQESRAAARMKLPPPPSRKF